MRLPKSVCGILVMKKLELKRFQSPNGSIVVKLKRSIYGLKQATDWFDDISRQFCSVCHYTPSTVDKCLFYKLRAGKLSIICLHVDDLLIVFQSLIRQMT
jgi:hypothetical protein